MRDVTDSIDTAWKTGRAVGDLRPVARVTVQHPKMRLRHYALRALFDYKAPNTSLETYVETDFEDWTKHPKVDQTYADFLFGNTQRPKELRNIKSVAWNRSVDSEVADCTIELFNATRGSDDVQVGGLFNPGYYTPTRGGSSFSSRWGQVANEWFGMLMPDNIVTTYEGYGTSDVDPDLNIPPELDKNLVQTGVWIIDTVQMSAAGTISIKCRDIGRILIDQMYWYPVVPKQFYNTDWSNWGDPPSIATAGGKLKLTAQDSSNTPWVGSGTIAGHKLSWAFDGNPNTYWLSVGNDKPSRRYAYEWVQAKVNNQSVSSVRIRTRKKGYTAYVSVKVGGVWQGKGKINYHEDGIGRNGADIKYVKSTTIKGEEFVTVTFDKPIEKVQAIRVTLSNLQNFNFGPYQYRAGIRDVEAFGPGGTKKGTVKKGPAGSNPGKYDDYTDIVKLLCAWGGFFWPEGGKIRSTENDVDAHGDGSPHYYTVSPKTFDTSVLGAGVRGRVWGDFQQTGTNGPAPLGFDNFDKKSLMDGIVYIRDILGFVFFIDETGAVQWRLANIWERGNWRSTFAAKPGYDKKNFVTIDETKSLVTLTSNLDGKNVREAYFVGVVNPMIDDAGTSIGAFAPGYNPNPTGLRRMAGWTDENFATQAECDMMADMLSVAQLVTYRTDSLRIMGYPKIQIDDQVRIFERTTAEGYMHYVKSIASSLDMSTGEYYFDLETQWMGEDPSAVWIVDPSKLKPGTKNYIDTTTSPGNSPMTGPSRNWTGHA